METKGRRQSKNVVILSDEVNKGNQKAAQRFRGGMKANRLTNPEPIEYSDEGSDVERNLKKKGVLNPANNTKATKRPVDTSDLKRDYGFFKHTENDLME